MLMPKKVKYRKQQRGRRAGKAWRGSTLAFGDYGFAEAKTTYGVIGVKCWIYRGEILKEKRREQQQAVATPGTF